MTTTIPVKFKCPDCNTRVTWPESAVDTTKLTCEKCGADLGTYGDLRDRAQDAVVKHIESILTDPSKRRR